MMHLVLWDIDHTLIETRGLGSDIYKRIFPSVTGIPLRGLASVDGRTELDIIHETLELHGIPPTDELIDKMATALARGYQAAIDELVDRGRVLPGATESLEALAREQEVTQSVLTGNTVEVAYIKLSAFGLDRHLDLSIGAYGNDHRDRSRLVDIARSRAIEQLDTPIQADQVILVGDTPNDVAAALTAGARVIGVASGRYSLEQLTSAGATWSVPALVSLPHLLRSAFPPEDDH